MPHFRIWMLFAILLLPVLTACNGVTIEPPPSIDIQNEDPQPQAPT